MRRSGLTKPCYTTCQQSIFVNSRSLQVQDCRGDLPSCPACLAPPSLRIAVPPLDFKLGFRIRGKPSRKREQKESGRGVRVIVCLRGLCARVKVSHDVPAKPVVNSKFAKPEKPTTKSHAPTSRIDFCSQRASQDHDNSTVTMVCGPILSTRRPHFEDDAEETRVDG